MATVAPDAAVVDRVKALTAAGERPALTDAEVISTIQAHPRVDTDGLTPEDDGWAPTWDLYAIVAELWGMKAGKVAGHFNFGADGSTFDKGAVLANCLAMEAKYAAMIGGSASTAAYTVDPLKGVVING